MIKYRTDGIWQILFVFQARGSVFGLSFLVAAPSALVSLMLKLLSDNEVFPEYSNMAFLASSGGTAAWSGFTFLVGFVIVFRTSQAYGRFWDALSDTHQMLASWYDAASSISSFASIAKVEERSVDIFMHTIIRLFSMLSASALQELSDVNDVHTWGLETLDSSAINPTSIATLDGSPCRVELIYQWIQTLVLKNIETGIMCVPPPILARSQAELSQGMMKFQDAMKHAKVPFPFPYAQTTMALLIFHWILTPCVMVQWSSWASGASIFTFVQVFSLWSLNLIAAGFESPFGGQANDIDADLLQKRINKQLVHLMEPRVRAMPFIDPHDIYDVDGLRKRDSMHVAALQAEGWELKNLETSKTMNGDPRCCLVCTRSCTKRCRKRYCRCCFRAPTTVGRTQVAVSTRYGVKRYGIVDDECTAVMTVGIFKDELILALPLSSDAAKKEAVVEVKNVKGETCKLRMKKVAIQARHGLRKDGYPEWGNKYLDFPPGYTFRAEVLVAAYHEYDNKLAFSSSAKVQGPGDLQVPRGDSRMLSAEGNASEAKEDGIASRLADISEQTPENDAGDVAVAMRQGQALDRQATGLEDRLTNPPDLPGAVNADQCELAGDGTPLVAARPASRVPTELSPSGGDEAWLSPRGTTPSLPPARKSTSGFEPSAPLSADLVAMEAGLEPLLESPSESGDVDAAMPNQSEHPDKENGDGAEPENGGTVLPWGASDLSDDLCLAPGAKASDENAYVTEDRPDPVVNASSADVAIATEESLLAEVLAEDHLSVVPEPLQPGWAPSQTKDLEG